MQNLLLSEFEGAAADLKSWGIPLAKLDGTKFQEIADKVWREGFALGQIGIT